MTATRIPELIGRLYGIVGELEALFPGRKFTLDGHLVGSIGKVIAAERYDLALLPASAKTHDAKAQDGRMIQNKVTQGTSVGLRDEPEHLLVLHLGQGGEVAEIFNGPGSLAWSVAGKLQKNSQRAISLSRIRQLMVVVPEHQTIPVRQA